MAKISISREKFLETIAASEVFAPEYIESVLEDLKPDASSAAIAKVLLDEGKLTRWQAKFLLTGRHHLKLGKYVLQDLLVRDSLGDRFVAHHASLDRLVQLQILPGALSEHPERFETFLQQAQLAAELDHPHLIHVYDIDKHSGRFYLVLEHVEGKLAASVELDELTDLDVAVLADQALDGIQTAHESGIVHGRLSLETMMLAGKNDLRITDMSLSTLRRQLENEADDGMTISMVPEDDLAAIGKAAVELLKRSNRSSSASSLIEILNHLSQIDENRTPTIEQIRGMLNSWIYENPAVSGEIFDEFDEEARAAENFDNNNIEAAVDDTFEKPAPATNEKKPNAEPKQPAKSKLGLIISLASIATLVVIIGVIVLLRTINNWNGDSTADDNSSIANISNSQDSNQKPVENTKPAEEYDGNFPEDIPEPVTKENPDKSKPADISSDEPGQDAENALVDKSANTVESSDSENGHSIEASSSNENTSAEPVTVPVDAMEESNSAESTPLPPKVFANLGSSFQLPQRTDSEGTAFVSPVIVAQIFSPDFKLDSLDLIENSQTRKKIEFVSNPESDQVWKVAIREKGNETEIGQFEFRDNLLWFQWNDAAAENEDADLLRNVVAAIAVGEEKRTVSLRQTFVLENLLLDTRKFVGEVSTEIPGLPPSEKLSLEIPLLPDSFPDHWIADEGRIVRGSENNAFAKIDFDEVPENRFLWLQLKPDFGRKGDFECRAEIRVQPIDQQMLGELVIKPVVDVNASKIYRPKLFVDLQNLIGGFQANLQAEFNRRKTAYDTRQVTENRGDFKKLNDKMSEALNKTNDSINALDIQSELVSELIGKPIPFQVFYHPDDQSKIEVIRSGLSAGGHAPYVDLNSDDNSTSVKNVVKNPGFEGTNGEFADWTFEFTSQGSKNDQHILAKSNNSVALETWSGTGNLTQAGLDVPNFGAGSGQSAQLSFVVGWEDSSKSSASTLVLSVSGVEVWQMQTAEGDSASETESTGLNGAILNTGQTIAKGDQMTMVKLDLPDSISRIENIRFSWKLGHDNFKIDDVQLLVNPQTSNIATYKKGEPCSVASANCIVSDADSNFLKWAKIVLTNPQEGDGFRIDDKFAKVGDTGKIFGTMLTYSLTRSDENQMILELVGDCPPIQYAYALSSVQFDNQSESPSADERYFDVILSDGQAQSEVAIATIEFADQ